MEAFLSSLPPYVHEFLDKEPPFEVFNVLRELICFAVLYSNDRKHIQLQTEQLLAENAEVSNPSSKEHGNDPKEDLSNTEPESTSDLVAHEGEQRVPEQTTKSPIPSTFPEWWGHLGGAEDATDENDNEKRTSHVEVPTVTKENDQVKQSVPGHRVKREQTAPYTTWIPLDSPSTRPKSTIVSINSITRSKPSANTKRHSIAITTPRRQSHASSHRQDDNEYHEDSKPQGLDRKAQTVSARLSYLAQPKRITEPVKATRSETLPATIHVATPRNVPLAKPAQTALVKARSIRARKQQEEKPREPVVAPIPAYVQKAKSKIDWDAIKREKRISQSQPPSFDFVPLDDPNESNEATHRSSNHEERLKE